MKALKRLLIALFRGSDSGQAITEYLILVGACALLGIAGFSRYGEAVKRDLSADAKHIEGEGLPNTEGILGSLGADYNEIPGWCVKPNYCFAAGTPVQTERGDRAIESIVVGDRVWARDVTTGAIGLRSVINTYRTARVPVIDLELSVGLVKSEHLAVTRSHLFWVEGPGWVRAEALGAEPLWSTEGATAARLRGAALGGESELTTVYNLEVSEFHSYFVGHSHVLVHNGNPTGDGCPTDATTPTTSPATSVTPATRTRPPRTWGEELECGETGSYYEELGGYDRTAKSMKQSRLSNGMERDHIPSTKALQVRAAELMDGLAKGMLRMRCRELTDEEQAALDTAEKAAAAGLDIEAQFDGFAVVEPRALHRAGRTHGNKNKTLFEEDSRHLDRAARRDATELAHLIYDGGPPLDPECEAKILAALKTIGTKTQQDFDLELGDLAQAALERSGFNKIIRDTCEGGSDSESQGQ